MSRPVFGQREQYIEASKLAAATQKALTAIRQLNIGVVFECVICHKMPYATDETWPCSHIKCYDFSLRGFGLNALNSAAKIWAAEKAADPAPEEPIPW